MKAQYFCASVLLIGLKLLLEIQKTTAKQVAIGYYIQGTTAAAAAAPPLRGDADSHPSLPPSRRRLNKSSFKSCLKGCCENVQVTVLLIYTTIVILKYRDLHAKAKCKHMYIRNHSIQYFNFMLDIQIRNCQKRRNGNFRAFICMLSYQYYQESSQNRTQFQENNCFQNWIR